MGDLSRFEVLREAPASTARTASICIQTHFERCHNGDLSVSYQQFAAMAVGENPKITRKMPPN